MNACVEVGGDGMMKSIGHYAGARIASTMDIQHGDFSPFRYSLQILSTHSAVWRAA